MTEDPPFDLWIHGARIATLDGAGYGRIVGADGSGALAVRDGRIAALGTRAELGEPRARSTVDARGAWLTPGLIDCHTHLVYAGVRADEFERRLEGATYEELARAGGGIRATVRATRAASLERLVAESTPRLGRLIAEGVTTVEIKSGYGLDLASERNMLRAARRLAERFPVEVTTTFLGAHAVPEEFEGRADAYVAHLTDDVLPALHAEGLVDAVDAFCETIGFTPAQVERLFVKARALGLPVKLHAEQLSNQEGAALVARFGGLSADHLEWLSARGIEALRAAGTVAVLLPGAFYFLRDTRLPPIDALRAAGVPLAVATDCNPGSSPLTSPLLAMNLACVLFRLTPAEALAGMTVHAARALGYDDRGRIAPGLRADLALWDVGSLAELSYAMGHAPLRARWVAGVADRS